MLRIQPVCLDVLRVVRPLADEIAKFDRDHARQLRRSSLSVYLNMAEGTGCRGGTRRARYDDALGSAEETRANLQAAEAVGYLGALDAELLDWLDRIIRTLTAIVHKKVA